MGLLFSNRAPTSNLFNVKAPTLTTGFNATQPTLTQPAPLTGVQTPQLRTSQVRTPPSFTNSPLAQALGQPSPQMQPSVQPNAARAGDEQYQQFVQRTQQEQAQKRSAWETRESAKFEKRQQYLEQARQAYEGTKQEYESGWSHDPGFMAAAERRWQDAQRAFGAQRRTYSGVRGGVGGLVPRMPPRGLAAALAAPVEQIQ